MQTQLDSVTRMTSRWLVCLLVLAGGASSRAAAAEPLPDPEVFLERVKETLLSDELLLSQYTYDEEYTGQRLDKKGRPKKTRTFVYEVFPSLDPNMAYRRLISRDGEPVPEKQLEKQDRKHAKKVREYLAQLEDSESKKQQRQEERRRKKEQESRDWADEVFRLFEFDMTCREDINGRTAIVFRLEPRPDYHVSVKSARYLQKMRGRLWVSEDDHQMIRLELDLMETLSVGGGLVARLHKGTHLEFQREKINDEIWLPSESRMSGSGRVFMVKRFRVDETRRYSNHQKYSTDASWTSDQPAEDPAR